MDTLTDPHARRLSSAGMITYRIVVRAVLVDIT